MCAHLSRAIFVLSIVAGTGTGTATSPGTNEQEHMGTLIDRFRINEHGKTHAGDKYEPALLTATFG